jgi:membrane-bound serine protease (ClpP class)
VVVSLLITIAILALYSELHKPTGMGAAVFMAALATFFWAQFLAGTAGPVSIIVFLLGLVLLLVEIFFIPGFGFAGVGGIVLMLAGMIGARIPADWFSPPKGFEVPGLQLAGLIGAVVPVVVGAGLSVLGIVLLMRFFPHLPVFRRLVLNTSLSGAAVSAAQAAGAGSIEALMGRQGTTTTTLRPGGSARFEDRLLDVVSDGEFLEAGTPVKIVSATGNRIVVRRA